MGKSSIKHSLVYLLSKSGRFGMRLRQALEYYKVRRKLPDFRNPRDISEIILSEMLKERFLEKAIYADKVRVREFVKSKGLGDILLEHYGTWEKADSIDFEKLPEKFVLKTNNGNSGHVFCRNKKNLDIEKVRDQLDRNLHLEDLRYAFEPHYKNIIPLILCEQFLDTDDGSLPTDYKFTCIKGEIADIFVAVERDKKAKYCTYDIQWNLLNYTKPGYLPSQLPSKPRLLSEMISVAEKLSEDFSFVRVDLYESNDRIYFGELTFSPWGGHMYSYTDQAIQILGNKYRVAHELS